MHFGSVTETFSAEQISVHGKAAAGADPAVAGRRRRRRGATHCAGITSCQRPRASFRAPHSTPRACAHRGRRRRALRRTPRASASSVEMPSTGRPRAKREALREAAGDAQSGERPRPGAEGDRVQLGPGVPGSASSSIGSASSECRLPARALERRRSRRRSTARPSTSRSRSRWRRSACPILYTARTMREHTIAVIPGDGIGREVIPEGVRVLEAVGAKHGLRFKWQEFPWSCDWYKAHGRMCPEDAPDILKQVRRDLLRRGRQPVDRPRPHLGLGPADQLPPLVRPVREPAPGAPVRGPALPARRPQAGRHRLRA